METIYTIYQYIFYKCFRAAWIGNRNWLNLRQESYIGSVARTAWLAVTLVMNANFVLLSLLISIFKGYYLLDFMANSPFICLVLFFIFLLINYFIFLYKRKYKKILKRFEDESRQSRIIGNILVASYVLILFPGSFILAASLSIFHLGKGL